MVVGQSAARSDHARDRRSDCAGRAEIWLDLGGALRATRDPGQAKIAFERSLALDPQPARAWLALALVDNELNERKNAEAGFMEALAREPKLGDAAFGLALVAFDDRRYVDAAEWFAKAIDLNAGGAIARTGSGRRSSSSAISPKRRRT